jgi:glycine hydroxymethyltransferase
MVWPGYAGVNSVYNAAMKDTQIKKLIAAETKRQKAVVNLIASENYVSDDVLEALGSVLTNKYAEGYPGARYYGGNQVIDQVESLAQNRALDLFGLKGIEWAANVQPLSGSPANLAVYAALVPIGGKIMGMRLSSGGHLTHGQKVSFTGKAWKQVPFSVSKETEMLDYDELMAIAKKEAPDIIVAGFTAYPRTIDWKRFRQIADACGALLMVDMSHIAGLVAGKQYEPPFPYADIVTTTVHKTLRGPRAGVIFSRRQALTKGPHAKADLSALIDKAIIPGLQGGPHENQIAAVAVALKEAKAPAFKAYAKQVIKNAQALAAELTKLGWRIVSGGTDSHLLLVDTWMGGEKKPSPDGKGMIGGIAGAEAERMLEAAGIIVNKNTVPHDPRGPLDPSGIRLGSAAETTRGRKEKDMVAIARKIHKALALTK